MRVHRSSDLDVIALAVVGLLVLHGAGLAPVGQLGALVLAGAGGMAAGRWTAGGGRIGAVARPAARRVVPMLILFTLGCALQARLGGDSSQFPSLRGSVTWTWLGFADIHAMVWRADGWDPGSYDAAAGTWVVCAAARPAVVWLLICSAAGGDVERQRRIAVLGLVACAIAAVLWLPGADDARRFYAPELTTAAALLGILLATGRSTATWSTPVVSLPAPVDGRLLLLGSLLWLTPVLGSLDGIDDGVGKAVMVAVALIAPALATSLLSTILGSSRVRDEPLAVLLPPAALLALLLLWQATGAFGYGPPRFV